MRSLNLFGMQISRWSQSAESAFVRAMELVSTDCTDEEMRDAVISAAGGDTSAIEEALTQVKDDMRRQPRSYRTDRVFRVFTAAIKKSPVEHTDHSYAGLYRRERWLDKLPLDAAIMELCKLSPTVRQYREDVLQARRSRYKKTGWMRSVLAEERLEKKVDTLVGPTSDAHEPLLRSSTASGVLMSWTREMTGLATANNDD